ncbi:MAG: hypothetical protein QM734_02315 [Cyclobacteriaceae bacterium]
MIKVLITAFASFVFVCAHSQSGYAILTNRDSISGEVKILYDDHLDHVQITANNKKGNYSALQIKRLVIGGEEFNPVKYELSFKFMKVLKRGYLTLYAFKPKGVYAWEGLFLYKKDGSSIEVPNLGFKKFISKFVEDCAGVKAKVEKGELGKRDLDAIVDQYNLCIQERSGKMEKPLTSENPITNETTDAVKKLISKIEKEDFSGKNDALNVLNDIYTKAAKNEKIPNYLTDALKTYLGPETSHAKDLEDLLSILKK